MGWLRAVAESAVKPRGTTPRHLTARAIGLLAPLAVVAGCGSTATDTVSTTATTDSRSTPRDANEVLASELEDLSIEVFTNDVGERCVEVASGESRRIEGSSCLPQSFPPHVVALTTARTSGAFVTTLSVPAEWTVDSAVDSRGSPIVFVVRAHAVFFIAPFQEVGDENVVILTNAAGDRATCLHLGLQISCDET